MLPDKTLTVRRILRIAQSLAPSAATFLLGTGSLFIADIWIGRTASAENVADWALFKSLAIPLSTLALAGMDQAVVREPSKLDLYFWKSILLSILISATSSIIVFIFHLYHNPFSIFISAFLLSSLGLYFGIFRANLLFNRAHLARDGWKALFLAFIILTYFTGYVNAPALLIISSCIMVALSFISWTRSSPHNTIEIHNDISSFRSALSISWPFCLAAFALSVASYGEVVLLRLFGADSVISLYFRAIVLFSYPSIILNTYLVTFISSIVRQEARVSSLIFIKLRWIAYPVLIIVPLLSLLFGYLIQPVIFPGHSTPFYLGLLLSCTSGMRFIYTALTSFVGALGDKNEIKLISVQYFGLALLVPVACWAIYASSNDIIFAVAASSAVHWLARSLLGWRLTMRLTRRALPQ